MVMKRSGSKFCELLMAEEISKIYLMLEDPKKITIDIRNSATTAISNSEIDRNVKMVNILLQEVSG